VECYTWLLDSELITTDFISGRKNFSKAVDYFVENMVRRGTADDATTFAQIQEMMTPRQTIELDEMCCTAVVRIFNFAVSLVKKSLDNDQNDFSKKFGSSNFWLQLYQTFYGRN
jgi:hypothetical protein